MPVPMRRACIVLALLPQLTMGWSGAITPLRPHSAATFPALAVQGAPKCRAPWLRVTTAPRLQAEQAEPSTEVEVQGAVEAQGAVATADAAGQSLTTTRQALLETALAVAAAIMFGIGVFATRGVDDASAWFAAYVLEESLSIDNLFVFSLIFDYFQTPGYAQPRVLRWGLIAAVVLRFSFIVAGLAVVERFKGVLVVRGYAERSALLGWGR